MHPVAYDIVIMTPFNIMWNCFAKLDYVSNLIFSVICGRMKQSYAYYQKNEKRTKNDCSYLQYLKQKTHKNLMQKNRFHDDENEESMYHAHISHMF